MIPFNKPFLCGKELDYIKEAVHTGKISGDGVFTKKCHAFFTAKYNYQTPLLTTSCTDALEMIALLCNIRPGDEVIAPSFTFVSTVNPFVMNGANIVFCDVKYEYPCIDEDKIEALVTSRTKAIIVMHYGGIACNMNKVLEIANRYNLLVIEDAAHAIDASYNGKPLGGIGDFGAFSFHETKNVIAGEGGMIVLNNLKYAARAEIIREKGTNRSKFFRGEIDKYNWVDVGSSFLPSEITAAFLYAQLENIDSIQSKRHLLWNTYFNNLRPLQEKGHLRLPVIPVFAGHNAHLFYIVTKSTEERYLLIEYLKSRGIMAIFHYQPLHSSPFWSSRYSGEPLSETDRFADTLVRLPLFYQLSIEDVKFISNEIENFYAGR